MINSLVLLGLLFPAYSGAWNTLTVSGNTSISETTFGSYMWYINTPRIFGQTTITFAIDSSSTATRNVDYKVNNLTCTIGDGKLCYIWIKPISVPGCDKPSGKTLVLRPISMTPVFGWTSLAGQAVFTFTDTSC